MRVPSASLATCRLRGGNKHGHVRIRHGRNSSSYPPWTPPPTHTSPIFLCFFFFPSISVPLTHTFSILALLPPSVPHFKYTPSVLIHYPLFLLLKSSPIPHFHPILPPRNGPEFFLGLSIHFFSPLLHCRCRRSLQILLLECHVRRHLPSWCSSTGMSSQILLILFAQGSVGLMAHLPRFR